VLASFYSDSFHGKIMANGEPFDNEDLSNAASLQFDLGTEVTLCDPKSEGKCLTVTITDRINPRYRNRIDLSKAAAGYFNFIEKGLETLIIKAVETPNQNKQQRNAPSNQGGPFFFPNELVL
jgi:rare lipoprotein A